MKSLTLVITLLFTFAAYAQFPGSKPELLLNKELKVLDRDSPKEYGYREFYKDHELEKVYACCQRYNSKYEKLVNRTFKVTAVEPIKGIKSRGGTAFMLTLEDGKETVYYRYDSKYESEFIFEVIGGLDIPAESYCKFIKEEESQAQKGSTFLVSDTKEGIFFFKMNVNSTVTYLVNITMPSDKIVAVGSGASIELENGHIINMPYAKVEAKDNGYGGKAYAASIVLTDKDVEMVKANRIVKATVNGISKTVEQGATHKGIFNCLVTRKITNICDRVMRSDEDDFYLYGAAVENVSLVKFIEKADNSVSYKLKLTIEKDIKKEIKSASASVMFENTTTITKRNAEVTVKPLANGKYEYSTSVDLTKEEVILLKNNNVDAVLISTFDVRITRGEIFKQLVNCMENKSALNL